ncbi:hypothetical protein [Catenulispora pinisilvae]|uniref:hypothetical protein n=1 Tax=Catenulispora pinisilvae TaxID=2705253 RepID=UPI0018925A3F|nr:hypothetical protein [Catenulispora pinisilvae]
MTLHVDHAAAETLAGFPIKLRVAREEAGLSQAEIGPLSLVRRFPQHGRTTDNQKRSTPQ